MQKALSAVLHYLLFGREPHAHKKTSANDLDIGAKPISKQFLWAEIYALYAQMSNRKAILRPSLSYLLQRLLSLFLMSLVLDMN